MARRDAVKIRGESEHKVHKTIVHALAWRSCVTTRARACACRPGYIVVAIKYIVFQGVLYNGFLLFIKAEGPLQSAAAVARRINDAHPPRITPLRTPL